MPRPPRARSTAPSGSVKAQIHAGGRGKGHFKETDAGDKGGVRLARSVEEAEQEARRMLGRTLVTKQTGEAGKQVAPRLYRGRRRHRARALSSHPRGPRHLRASPSWSRPKAAWTSRRSLHRPREDPDPHRGPRDRLPALSRPPHRLRARARGRAGQAVRLADGQALQSLRGQGHGDAGDQPADRHQGGPAPLPRRQGRIRQQRALQAPDIAALADDTEVDPKELAASSSTSTTSRSTARSAAW
jgi:hypothetical protein